MPARQSKSKPRTKATVKKQMVVKETTGKTRSRPRSRPVPGRNWKVVAKPTKNFVLNTFDAGVRLLMHKVQEHVYSDVHSVLINARNQVAVSLETLKVPPSKEDYGHLSTTLSELKEAREKLYQRKTSLVRMMEKQENELKRLEDKKALLQDFGKLPGKHHPILLEPLEKELHLNFNTVK